MVGYNSASWIRRCVESALNQDYSDFEVIAIDAETNDGTYDILKEYQSHDNFKLIRNNPRRYQSENILTGVIESKEKSIVCTLDFDDWFPDNNVLSYLNELYDENTYMTYGNYFDYYDENHVYPQSKTRYSDEVIKNNLFRESNWQATHLRTFRRELFLEINPDDFIDNTTDMMYTMAGDLSFMLPMLEMSGERFKVAERPLYVYNKTNPMSDDKVNIAEQVRQADQIKARKKYERLRNLYELNCER